MKKLLLIPAMIGTLAMATDFNYELTPVIGYNFAEDNINLDDQVMSGIEAQYNGFDFPIKPELSVLYSGGIKSDDNNNHEQTNITRFGLNGIYEIDALESVVPFLKAGIGYETMNRHIDKNTDSEFYNAGAGVKIPFTEALALKLESVYMLKNNDGRWDNNLAVLAGLNYKFGAKAQPVPVDGDDDNDGVLNSLDKCPTTPAGNEVDANGCCLDDDNDGVINSLDNCPTTPAGNKVDAKGCCVDGDDDHDGVLNSVDKCPNSMEGANVDTDGCLVSINLEVLFDFDSANTKAEANEKVEKFSTFLKTYKNYTATIIGHTDSIGSATYNQKLSEKRANDVKAMIVNNGVEADRIAVVGKGESEPVVSNDTKENRALNRRVMGQVSKN